MELYRKMDRRTNLWAQTILATGLIVASLFAGFWGPVGGWHWIAATALFVFGIAYQWRRLLNSERVDPAGPNPDAPSAPN